jgi:trimethylamine--corrinoid protein Co-methyltransferase
MSTQVQPTYRLLTDEQIEHIHRASLEILATVGIRIPHDDALQMLREAGCRVKDGDVVLFPLGLVEDCMRSVPPRVTIYDRNGHEAMCLGDRNTYFGTGTDLIRTIDLYSGEARLSVMADVVNAARVSDHCGNIDFIASCALPGDVPVSAMYLRCAKAMLENSTKPIFFTAAGRDDLAFIIEMASAVAGGEQTLREKPFIIHYSQPTAPLSHSNGAVNKVLLCAERGIPICYTTTDLLGASSPVTVAAGIVQANAENLSGIVMHQLKARGAPIISGFAVVGLDMKTMAISYGAPEWRLTNSALADLYHHYGIPMWSTVGSDTHCLDEQASMEHVFGTLLAALDGANLIHDVGYLGQGLLGDPAAIVMCDEIISYVKRILRGFDLNDETMALDVIRAVGPGGNYLTQAHTAQHFRRELWRPKHANRDNPETWAGKGGLRYGERVRQKTREILAAHRPEPLPEAIATRLNEIAARAEQSLAGVQFAA